MSKLKLQGTLLKMRRLMRIVTIPRDLTRKVKVRTKVRVKRKLKTMDGHMRKLHEKGRRFGLG